MGIRMDINVQIFMSSSLDFFYIVDTLLVSAKCPSLSAPNTRPPLHSTVSGVRQLLLYTESLLIFENLITKRNLKEQVTPFQRDSERPKEQEVVKIFLKKKVIFKKEFLLMALFTGSCISKKSCCLPQLHSTI
jgi:predicted metal-binding protein